MTATPALFEAPTYALGAVVLRPIGGDAGTLAARLAELDPWARTGRTAAAFLAAMSTPMPGTHRFAIDLDGRLAGCLVLRHPFMRGPYVETIAVFPEAQRRGVARTVIEWIAAEAAATAPNIWLCVTEWNAPARAFYAALGFVEVGPLPDLAAPGVGEIFLRRVLGPPIP